MNKTLKNKDTEKHRKLLLKKGKIKCDLREEVSLMKEILRV